MCAVQCETHLDFDLQYTTENCNPIIFEQANTAVYTCYTLNHQKYWLLVILKIYFLIAKLGFLFSGKNAALYSSRNPKFYRK